MASQIGLQLYTLRNFLKTPTDIAQTLSRVKKMGYDAVELAGLGPIEPAELKKMLDGEGLVCCSGHVSTNDVQNQLQKTIDNYKLWGCAYVIIASFGPRDATTQTWVDFAQRCNEQAKSVSSAGMMLGYHNHSHEFVHYDGKPGLQILREHFSPQVIFELDLHWVARGGGDPAEWIEKMGSHATCLHMKDFSVLPDRTPQFAEVGEGNMNWPRILAAAKQAGVKWYIVEQDETYGKDAFACVEKSLKNMKGMGLS
jgi:sugar phosphate isomerase/epimerase